MFNAKAERWLKMRGWKGSGGRQRIPSNSVRSNPSLSTDQRQTPSGLTRWPVFRPPTWTQQGRSLSSKTQHTPASSAALPRRAGEVCGTQGRNPSLRCTGAMCPHHAPPCPRYCWRTPEVYVWNNGFSTSRHIHPANLAETQTQSRYTHTTCKPCRGIDIVRHGARPWTI